MTYTNEQLQELRFWCMEQFKDIPNAHNAPIDPAAAMQVLEKCVENKSAIITKDADGQFSIEWWVDEINGIKPIQGSRWHQIKTAETIPLAICLFAMELFKEGK